ncbi:MAG TPA: hypothetical protein P5268_00685 [Candidatus Marinimicrobia bacterium]|nr:hypothetical protein [Candidatus Neomarinimicrobiota bacterium]HRU91528.1 hypothetical protein [Candidatus Neomarinimicrobiota bacterium]
MKVKNYYIHLVIIFGLLIGWSNSFAQRKSTHTRGKLWETLNNVGLIGDLGVWDYEETSGLGFYPGFSGYSYPTFEEDANGWITDANFHNFRSGPALVIKGGEVLVAPDYGPQHQDYLFYHSSFAGGNHGILWNYPPFKKTNNFVGMSQFNPLLPEEMNYCEFPTATGISVKMRSMAWSFPDYDDFIIYDYVFINTGEMVIPSLGEIMHYEQSFDSVFVVFHSGIQVSTKGQLNFHYDPNFMKSAAPAGGFGGWKQLENGGTYTDYFAVENDGNDGKGLFFYSRDYNGGREPHPNDTYTKRSDWKTRLKYNPTYENIELQDPACFGFVFLYRTPPTGSGADPFEADPNFFNIYSDEGEQFQGRSLDMNEYFSIERLGEKGMFDFVTHSRIPEENNGDMYCFYTATFGPYSLAPGDSVRLILAEVAGSLDYHEVIKGDPNHWYPDSSIAAIRRNAEAARRALKWGFGATVEGINLAADVPESPPAPNCSATNASKGSDTAIIAIQWDKLAEEAVITDGAGNIFYDGSTDLGGYRIFRGIDKRGIWDEIVDIPAAELNRYWNPEIGKYLYLDMDLQFGFEYRYYVQAYYSHPKTWVSANNSVVGNLGELVSDDYNMTPLTGARPGPVDITGGWDVFVAPNPYIEGDPERSFGDPTPYKIEFRNLPERATIKIFTVSGDLVKTIEHGPDVYGNLSGSVAWDQRTDSGLRVAPGVYIYAIESHTKGTKGKRTIGKLMIIR